MRRIRLFVLLLVSAVVCGTAAGQDIFTVTTAADDGPGSFRVTILDANANPDPAVIAFDVPGALPVEITPAFELPAITNTVHIDGTTQPGWEDGPVVNVRYSFGPVLYFGPGSDGSILEGMSVTGAGTTSTSSECVRIEAPDVTVKSGYFGLLPNGNPDGCGVGVFVAAPGATIGGPEAGDRTVISSNRRAGIRIFSDGDVNLTIQNTYVGVGPDGETPRNNWHQGIDLQKGDNVTIRDNVLAGSNVDLHPAVQVGSSSAPPVEDVQIVNNIIGTNAAGTQSMSGMAAGIHISWANNVTIEGNLISGNGSYGVHVLPPATAGNGIQIVGNTIGLNGAGDAPLPNMTGIEVTGEGVQITGNTIAGNSGPGLVLFRTENSVIQGNTIGLTESGQLMPNGDPQLRVGLDSANNQIGGSERSGEGNTFGVSAPDPGAPLSGTAVHVQSVAGRSNTIETPVSERFSTAASTPLDDLPEPIRNELFPLAQLIIHEALLVTDQDIENLQLKMIVSEDESYRHLGLSIFILRLFGLADLPPPGFWRGDELWEIVAVGNDVYTVEDQTGCGDPPCPKEIIVELPFEITPVTYVLVLATDEDGTTGEFSNPFEIKFDVDTEDEPGEGSVSLQNYPNPFTGTTTIAFQLAVSTEVVLKVYDVLGREIATLADGLMSSGSHTIGFDASGLTAGIYMYELRTVDFRLVRKMLLVR